MMPAPRASRSSGLPGVAAASAANGLWLVSPMSSTLTKASTRMVPWMNRVGRSTATAPSTATCPGLPLAYRLCVEATTMVRMNAAASDPRDRIRCVVRRAERGANASTRTPATMRSQQLDEGFGDEGDSEAPFDKVEQGVGVVDLELVSGLYPRGPLWPHRRGFGYPTRPGNRPGAARAAL